MKIPKSRRIGSLDLAGMARPDAEDQQIISKGSRGALHGPRKVSPGMKQEGHHGHAQGASLRYAAGVAMGLPKATSNRVEEEA